MADQQIDRVELQPLADIDQVIHAPARLMVMTYLTESGGCVMLRGVSTRRASAGSWLELR
jgi:hypothetical protein